MTVKATVKAEDVRPEQTALIVIDMQNDYVHHDGAVLRYYREHYQSRAGLDGPTMAEQMVPNLIRLVDGARAAGVTVIWVVTYQSPWTEQAYWQTRWRPTEQAAVDWGNALYDGLVPRKNEPMVIKHRHSCFFATDMNLILRQLRVETVLMTGVGTPYCVEGSARDAFSHDYRVFTISDGTATREKSEHDAALARLGSVFGHVASSDEIMAAWAEVQPTPNLTIRTNSTK